MRMKCGGHRAVASALLLAILTSTASACGQSPPPKRPARSIKSTPKTTGTAAIPAPPADRATLTKLPRAGLPLVTVKVKGKTTLALFDTGATAHLLSKRFLATINAKVESTGGNDAVDHNGKIFRLEKVRAPIRIEGFSHDEKGDLFAADLPKSLHEVGVGAIVSPSLLAGSGERVEIDFRENVVLRTKSATGESKDNVVLAEELCKDESGGKLYGLSAMIGQAGGMPSLVRLLVDSGSDRSDLFKDGPKGKTLLPLVTSSRKATVATGEAKAKTVDDIEVRVGAWKWLLDLDLIGGAGDPGCPRDGVLGMDALSRCKLVMQSGELSVSCD